MGVPMDRKETAVVSKNMFGNQEYQERARRALPILVRQAKANQPVFYQQLADELGMLNPRNLNYPLGSIGQTLLELGARWNESIPPIQCLVINQADRIPGEGFAWFMPGIDWKRLSKAAKRRHTDFMVQRIGLYPKWNEVLAALELAPIQALDFTELMSDAARIQRGGESEAHRMLKQFVSENPHVIGLRSVMEQVQLERRIPSGDAIDVFFASRAEWTAVEIKPESSDEADLTRGLYQCVKYEAVLRAMAVALQLDVTTQSILAIGGRLSPKLRTLRSMLGITVFEGIVART